MSNIPQCNPGANVLRHRAAIFKAVEGVIDSGYYILGGACRAFETAFAAYHGETACVGVASGTDAIELILRALGIGVGDRVATVANTAVATVAAIGRAGAVPRFADIDPSTYDMCPESLAQLLERDAGIKAVVIVHLFGHPASMDKLSLIAKAHGVPVIEDCAQAHGAQIAGRKVGTIGVAGAFSFYPTKNLGALGDGGAIITVDRQLAETIRILRQYGWRERYVSDVRGVNSRLDELQAAILLAKLPYLESENERRRKIASIYRQGLNSLDGIILPGEQTGVQHVYHQFVLLVRNRSEIVRKLSDAGIGTAIHYPVAIHRQPAYRDVPLIVQLPETERLNDSILSLPMYPELTDEEAERVIETVKKVCG